MKNNNTHKKILLGIIVGIILGVLFGGFLPGLSKNFAILGDIFLNLLMMIVVPLVILSIIVGITNLGDIRNIGSIGKRTIIYYLATTGLSVFIGLVLVNIINPGEGVTPGEKIPELKYKIEINNDKKVIFESNSINLKRYNKRYHIVLTDQKIIGKIIKTGKNSITVGSWERQEKGETIYLKRRNGEFIPIKKMDETLLFDKIIPKNEGNGIEIVLLLVKNIQKNKNRDAVDTIKEVFIGNKADKREGMIPRNLFNAMQKMAILPLIFFSLLFGAALSVLGENGKKVIDIISILNDAVMKIVGWIMFIAPIGIFGIISARIGNAGGFKEFLPELIAVGKYSFTVILGLTIHSVLVLSAILYFIGKRNPYIFMKGVGAALLNAFSTASSSATLPLTMETIEKQNGISKRTGSFVLPIGATINMDGTALYEAVAVMFIAQVYGISLGPVEQVIVFLTATLAAVGAAGIPEAGLVTMVIVLKAVNLPIEGIGLILTIDWLLDRFRTTVNVWGDSVGAGVIETLENKDK